MPGETAQVTECRNAAFRHSVSCGPISHFVKAFVGIRSGEGRKKERRKRKERGRRKDQGVKKEMGTKEGRRREQGGMKEGMTMKCSGNKRE